MSTVRLKRLAADYQQLREYVRAHPRLKLIQCEGDPPERYQLEYRVNSLRNVGGELQPATTHTVEIVLPRNYPRTPPMCRMLTPVFHPNIAPHAICVGDHWSPGEPLGSIVMRIGELLAYQSYNVKSPLNGEAARWVAENEHKLPLDTVSLLPEEVADDEASLAPVAPKPRPPAAAQSSARSAEKRLTSCPGCQKRFRVDAALIGRQAKCPECGAGFEMLPVEAT
jgi:ubiquitin-protein ligase